MSATLPRESTYSRVSMQWMTINITRTVVCLLEHADHKGFLTTRLPLSRNLVLVFHLSARNRSDAHCRFTSSQFISPILSLCSLPLFSASPSETLRLRASPKNGLDSLFKEVRVFKEAHACYDFAKNGTCISGGIEASWRHKQQQSCVATCRVSHKARNPGKIK